MGNPKQKWTAEEEQALRNGIAKHGTGKWKCIQKDPEFHRYLSSRSNIDLKDKWRNMSSPGQGSRSSKPKPSQDAPAAPVPSVNIQTPPVLPVVHEPLVDQVKVDPAKDIPEGKNLASDTTTLIFEALAKHQNGLEIGALISYIEERTTIKAPQSFRKQLGTKLRRLVQQEKLEKHPLQAGYCYKLKNSSSVETNQKDICPRQPLPRQPSAIAGIKVGESLEEAAKTAAYKVAEAEEKSYYAVLAVRELERLSMMQEEADSMLQLAREIYDRCNNGEVLLVA